jgi:hypothetical protein
MVPVGRLPLVREKSIFRSRAGIGLLQAPGAGCPGITSAYKNCLHIISSFISKRYPKRSND